MRRTEKSRLHRAIALGAAILLLSVVALPILAQNSGIQYFYDDLGQLIRAVDQNGNVATYTYDAVGNLLSITRSTLPPSNGLAILNFTPQSGPVGQSVTIQGQGFSATASSNTVQFNGVAAAGTAATSNALTVTVPSAATTGLISLTVSGQSASSTTPFTVTAGVLQSIAISPANSLIHEGLQTQQLTATGTFVNGSQQNVTTSVQWGSSNLSVATVGNASGSQGVVTSVSVGTATITAIDGQISATATVQIIGPQSLVLTPTSATMFAGNSQQFTPTVTFTDGTTANVSAQSSWSSTNTLVATVSNTGIVNPMAAGSASICAMFVGSSACSNVEVVSQPTSLTIAPTNVTIPIGTQQFVATGTNGQIITSEVSWSSSNTAVATISNTSDTQGLATGLSVGTTKITATAGTLTASTMLTITAAVPTVTVSPGRDIIQQGNSFQFKATLDNTNGSTQDVTQTANWESSATSVATVNSQGQVTAVAPGSATITAASGSATGSASVIVTNSAQATVPRYVYESAYSDNGNVGTVSVYSVNPSTGQLRSLGFVSQAGDSSTLALDPASQYLYIANTASNNVPNTLSVYTVGANGSLTPLATPPVATGNYPNAVAADPLGRFVYVVNGSDETVSGFAVGPNGGLTAVPGSPFPVDFGAMAVIVDPSGQFVYVLNTSSATISAFTLDPNSGALTPIAGSPFAAGSDPVTFAVDPAGKFLLVGNPGQSSGSSDALPPAGLPGPKADRLVLLATLESWPLEDFSSSNAAEPMAPNPSSLLRPIDWSFASDSMPRLLPSASGMIFAGGTDSGQKAIARPNCGTADSVKRGTAQPDNCGSGPTSISVFSINASTGALTQVNNSPFTVSGQPDSIAINPSDSFVYVTYDTNLVDGFAFNATSGNLTELPDAPYVTSGSQLSNVSVDPSGEFVYAAGGSYSVGSNLLAFSLNSATGTLSAVGTAPGPSGSHELAISSGATGVTYTPQFAYVLSAGGGNGANNISGYSINPTSGALTPLAGSPFAEGYSPVAATVDPWNPFLYVTNNCSDTSCTAAAGSISAYTIDPVAGTLAPALGSPYAIGLSPFGIAVDPSGSYVYVVDNQDENIWGNSINLPIGSLSPLIGSPVYAIENGSVAVGFDPVGAHVYTLASADYYVNKCTQNCTSGHLYVYNYPLFGSTTTGQTAVVENVDIVGPSPSSLALDSANWFALVPDSTTSVVYVVSTTNATQVPGSPFATGQNPLSVTVDPSGRFVYVANQGSNNVSAYTINQTTGVLSPIPGSPFAVGNGPVFVAVDLSGSFVYVTNQGDNTVSAFSLNPASGALTPIAGSPFNTGTAPISVVTTGTVR
jgi:YD repeat-containing protein